MNEKITRITEQIIKSRDIQALFTLFYKDQPILTEGQKKIAKTIIYPEHQRVLISAYTRYGKTWVTARTIAIVLAIRSNIKVAIVGPTQKQTKILRDYLATAVTKSEILQNIIDIQPSKIDRLTSESTKRTQTFKNGSKYKCLSARKEDSLMGFGADIIITDEDALISQDGQANISRMKGDNPEGYKHIRLFNPSSKDTATYQAWKNPKWEKIQIDYKQGIREGRTTKQFIEDQREEIPPVKFTIQYKSEFPDTTEDQLINNEDVNKSIKEDPYKDKKGHLVSYNIGVDVAGRGKDKTVWTHSKTYQENKELHHHIYTVTSEKISDNMRVAYNTQRKAVEIRKKDPDTPIKIYVDGHGIGTGVVSRLRELQRKQALPKQTRINKAMFGEKTKSKDYKNKKAQKYWDVRQAFIDQQITINPDTKHVNKIKNNLGLIEWELTSTGKIKVNDTNIMSSDYADSLVYSLWDLDRYKKNVKRKKGVVGVSTLRK